MLNFFSILRTKPRVSAESSNPPKTGVQYGPSCCCYARCLCFSSSISAALRLMASLSVLQQLQGHSLHSQRSPTHLVRCFKNSQNSLELSLRPVQARSPLVCIHQYMFSIALCFAKQGTVCAARGRQMEKVLSQSAC